MTHIRLYDALFATLAACATLFNVVAADPKSVCKSTGVNFIDGKTYTIKSGSSAPVTVVSQFAGCNADTANVQITSPDGTIFPCSSVPLTPANTDETSTCSINENQITPGDWIIVLLSNNGDGKPFAAQRTITFTTGSPVSSSAGPGSSKPTDTVTVTVTTTESGGKAAVTVTTTVDGPAGASYAATTTTTAVSTQTCTVEVQDWVKIIEVHEAGITSAAPAPGGYGAWKRGESVDKPAQATVTTTVTVGGGEASTTTVTSTRGWAQATVTECSVSTTYTTITSTYTTSITSYASSYPTSSAW